MLSKLERKLGRFGVPNLTLVLIACQVLMYGITYTRPEAAANVVLVPQLVLQGEVWRLFTFLAMPPFGILIFAIINWMLLYMMGSALESAWGAFRYNVFLLIGYLATIAAAFVFPSAVVSNIYWQGSIFLAFAWLYPDFVMQLYFILPVKVKWLALIQIASYVAVWIQSGWPVRLIVAASFMNLVTFFGKEAVESLKNRRRRVAWQAKTAANNEQPFHRCLVCGITDKTHPQMEFRYCSKCDGACGYCSEHIRNHTHVTKPTDAVPT